METLYRHLFTLLFLLTIIIRIYYWILAYGGAEKPSRIQNEGFLLFTIRSILSNSCIAVSILYIVRPDTVALLSVPLPPSIRWIGAAATIGGLLVLLWTHHHLGQNFTDTTYVRKNNQLITSGPYAFVRHPMYGAAFLLFFGAGFLAANWYIGILGTLMIVIVAIFRTPTEEKRLLERYGDVYIKYMERTAKFVPGILHKD